MMKFTCMTAVMLALVALYAMGHELPKGKTLKILT